MVPIRVHLHDTRNTGAANVWTAANDLHLFHSHDLFGGVTGRLEWARERSVVTCGGMVDAMRRTIAEHSGR